MATMREVARLAGVSVATVSRVLNNTGYVHEDTRKRVESVIEQLEYSPNEVARSLFKKESRIIGLLLPDITNPFFPQLARGIEDEAQKQGYHLLFGNSDEKLEKELQYIQTFLQNNVVGLITVSISSGKLNYDDISIPTVFLDRGSEEDFYVYADGREGGKLAALEMIKRGSRNIAVIKGPANLHSAQERFQGAIDVLMNEYVDFQVISTDSYAFLDAKEWARELFDKYPETDGVIASNDITATAVLHEALQRGKKVPDEVQIIGYDDIPQSSLLFPALSTIRQPAYEMGKEAAALLISIIKKETVEKKHIKLPVTYINRETTRRLNADG
ncbi:MAG: LacI family DNA-binding transcriptional regulator [Bacillus sp. (in: firmicutes)]